jgi:hypothetical protein
LLLQEKPVNNLIITHGHHKAVPATKPVKVLLVVNAVAVTPSNNCILGPTPDVTLIVIVPLLSPLQITLVTTGVASNSSRNWIQMLWWQYKRHHLPQNIVSGI